MSNINRVKKAIDEYSNSIAEELADIRMWEVHRVKAVITTRMWFALTECAELQALEYELERSGLVQQYADPNTPTWKKMKLQKELAELNLKSKQSNRLLNDMRDASEYNKLKNYLKAKGLGDLLQTFYDEETVLRPTKKDRLSCKSTTGTRE